MRLRVRAGARATAIVGAHGGALKLSVAAPPEKGKANRAVVRLLARTFDLPESAVAITAGTTSQDKIAELAIDPGSARARLEAREPPRTP